MLNPDQDCFPALILKKSLMFWAFFQHSFVFFDPTEDNHKDINHVLAAGGGLCMKINGAC